VRNSLEFVGILNYWPILAKPLLFDWFFRCFLFLFCVYSLLWPIFCLGWEWKCCICRLCGSHTEYGSLFPCSQAISIFNII